MNTILRKVGKRERKFFGKVPENMSIYEDLVKIQKDSFNNFLNKSLMESIKRYMPIRVPIKTAAKKNKEILIDFVDVTYENPSISESECLDKGLTYSAKAFLKVRITDTSTGEMIEKDDVFLCNIPYLTDRGIFIINGAERVVVNQLVRSPGIYFIKEEETDSTKEMLIAHFLPVKGAWLEILINPNPGKEILQVRIDRKRKFNLFLFYRALGYENDLDILSLFPENVDLEDEFEVSKYKDCTVLSDLFFEELEKLEPPRKTTKGMILSDVIELFKNNGIKNIKVANRVAQITLDRMKKRYEKEGNLTSLEAYKEIYSKLKPTEIPRAQKAKEEIEDMYFNPSKFDFSEIGRQKAQTKLTQAYIDYLKEVEGKEIPQETAEKIKYPISSLAIDKLDIVLATRYLLKLEEYPEGLDTRDHLGNKRVRSVGELMQIEFERAFSKMIQHIPEKVAMSPALNKINPQSLINSRAIMIAFHQFFASSQLSQFLDQVNPLAELTHKRRLSAIGPGGLKREHAKFEVRDVHHSHYGRMCPIETPEGANIGLITSLAILAKVDEYGFLKTPYYKVKNAKIDYKNIIYLTADEEELHKIAPASIKITEDGVLEDEYVEARYLGKVTLFHKDEIEYISVTPKQIASVSAALIPFLEHDDANRALMGSNMQRQAVPLLKPDAPFVGTGVEWLAARDSGYLIMAKHRGIVEYVDGRKIIVKRLNKNNEPELDSDGNEIKDQYHLMKYVRSNQDMCINQVPIVDMEDIVEEGEPLADGPSMDMGELALGKNIAVGFLSWEGYNFEDAIVVSQELLENDTFTSIHIEVYETKAMDTQLGPEEITADIPNVKKELLRNLDENGIVKVGSYVSSGDILVGKVTPRGESDTTPEEKLIKSVFGDKGRDVKDTSLTLPHGVEGRVIDVQIFDRKDIPSLEIGVNKYVKVFIATKKTLESGDKLAGRHGNKGVISTILNKEDMPFLPDGTPLQMLLSPLGVPSRMNIGQILELHLGWLSMLTGDYYASPIFDGASEEEIMTELSKIRKEKGLYLGDDEKNPTGKIILRDGRTGEPFDFPVAVGSMYMLKLSHIAKDKIHARSTGPYSLIHQQPLGGKAHFGGQRFGEMEVWALEAHGAAHTLNEMLTYKSDDIKGRNEVYKSVLKGENLPEPGIPESFKVLMKELQGLLLDIKLYDEEGNELDIDKL
ncbi:DNA-directed RNA polymerase subunit beta [Petrotoga sp. 9PWA.NaAc.5.4]|uniref:DNA-directed RNA polymerase subunit beta n=1 Tax=Petrotoga sp. 9PWA.NaAc.5.4 TaxID=1434328 RepID=UPI000CC7A312|nr:DNA-directed RNA polymerase subunit beta [Petrotoga sp. 9PWA.NaAc.5.4]PNR95949.1 DNA-directed RNA polymerase subunit beta [Petrotoga sp. 9PWA.NaAc.5.4]